MPTTRLQTAATLGPVVVDIEGTTLCEKDRARIAHPLAGAVILFTRNFESIEALAALTDEIHRIRPGIVITVDHEGGRVQRFREGFAQVPEMRALALHADAPRLMAAAGYVLASELRAVGVDFTYAPVLDVDYGRSSVIGSRSLGTTPEAVAANARALIGGLRLAGMACCGKHFPGHGWPVVDSHVALPEDERELEALEADAEVYRALSLELDSVMTAHVAYAAFDGNVATYEPRLLKGVLRERFGFSGLVFSDDLSMKGAGRLAPVERAERALAAGCDALLYCNHPDELDEVLGGLAWVRSSEFNARLARLIPVGDAAPSLEALRRSEAYRAARRTLCEAGFESAFEAID